MAQFYEMPAISPTMEMGTLVAWRVKEGESFRSGAILAEIGTDKANMEAEIFDKGVLLKQLVSEGDEIPPGFPIAIWGAAGDDLSALLAEFTRRKATLAAGAPVAAAPVAAAPVAAAPVAAAPVAAAPVAPVRAATVERYWMGKPIHGLFYEPPGDLRFGGASGATSGAAPANGAGRPLASPLARKLAAERGLSLEGLTGSGPGGRIVAADLDRVPARAKAPASAPTPAGRADEVVRNTPMRKTIARRLTESHQQIPTFFLTVAFDGQGFVSLREDLKRKLPDLKVSYNDMLVMAVARSLREHPQVNASWGDKEIVRHGRVDIGIAVAMPDGLITPVLRDAARLTLTQIADTVRDLAGKARAQKLAPEEYTGATFTISNLGMFGIEHFTAIINPPESAILAVGALEHVPVVVDGALSTGHRMRVTMTCDHRVIDGAVGAAFLQTLRRYVESPWLLLV